MNRFWNKVNKTADCWLWTAGKDDFGYGQFSFQGKNIKAHRVSFYLTYGTWPVVSRHTCDNPSCVRPEHILDGTYQSNNDDIFLRERNSGLKKSDVEVIRNIPMSRTIIADVARAYNISEEVARDVISGKTWSRLPGGRKIIRQKSRSKLSIQDILDIKKALESPYWGQVNELASRYGVTHSEISHIKSGRIHSDVSTNKN